MYSNVILEHFTSPINLGKIQHADYIGEARDEASGDIVKFYFAVEKGKIVDAKFKALGNAVTIAACDLLCEKVRDMPINDAKLITEAKISEWVGEIPKEKQYLFGILLSAIHNAML